MSGVFELLQEISIQNQALIVFNKITIILVKVPILVYCIIFNILINIYVLDQKDKSGRKPKQQKHSGKFIYYLLLSI